MVTWVLHWESVLGLSHCRLVEAMAPKCEKRHLFKVASQFSNAGHWPPSDLYGSGFSTARFSGSPAGFSLFLRAAHWRLLVPGTLCVSGSLGLPSAAV